MYYACGKWPTSRVVSFSKTIPYLISTVTQGSKSRNWYSVTFCRTLVHFGDSCNVCLAAAMHAAATNDGFSGIRHTSVIRSHVLDYSQQKQRSVHSASLHTLDFTYTLVFWVVVSHSRYLSTVVKLISHTADTILSAQACFVMCQYFYRTEKRLITRIYFKCFSFQT